MKTEVEEIESLAQRINIDRYSSYYKLIRVTCRIISCYKILPSLSFRNILMQPSPAELNCAMLFWVGEAQSSIKDFEKRFVRLGPIKDERGT